MKKKQKREVINKQNQAIERIGRGLLEFWMISCLFFFYFLGALQQKFHFENTIFADVDKTLGSAGLAVIRAFMNQGIEHTTWWLIGFPLVIILAFYLFVYSIIKEEWSNLKSVKGGVK